MILQVVRELVAERVAPRAAEIDESGEFPWDIQKLFAENDLLGYLVGRYFGLKWFGRIYSVLLGTYRFDRYLTGDKRPPPPLGALTTVFAV